MLVAYYSLGGVVTKEDETGRYDFWSRVLLHHSPFLFPLFLGGKRKGEWSSKNRDQKSYLPVSSRIPSQSHPVGRIGRKY